MTETWLITHIRRGVIDPITPAAVVRRLRAEIEDIKRYQKEDTRQMPVLALLSSYSEWYTAYSALRHEGYKIKIEVDRRFYRFFTLEGVHISMFFRLTSLQGPITRLKAEKLSELKRSVRQLRVDEASLSAERMALERELKMLEDDE